MRAVDNLHVDSKLPSAIVEDKDANRAAARLKGIGKTGPEVGLVNDGQTLLDVTTLGHSDNGTVSHVEDTVLLEDGAEHGLHNDAGAGVGDEGGLFVELLAEEVNTEIAVLASGRGGRDADDLAGAALEHHKVTEADVVARNRDSVGELRLGATGTAVRRAGDPDIFLNLNIDMTLAAAGVSDALTELVKPSAERVVAA